jgi:hypothetical protein
VKASGGASSRRRRQWRAADRGVLGREPQLWAFIVDKRAPWQILFMSKRPVRQGAVRRASACGRGRRIDGAAASAHTPRGARVLRLRRGLEVRAALTHTGLTPKLRGPALVRRCTASARRRRVASRRARSRPGPSGVPCLLAQFSKIYM